MKVFRAAMFVLALFPVITGIIDLIFAAQAINLLGPALPQEALSNPTLNSQIRFFGAIWIGYGAALVLVGIDPVANATMFRLLAAFLIVSGIARLASIVQFGLPAAPLVGATIAELLFVPLVMLWHHRLVRRA
jgi:hypothetical protein